MYVSFEEYSETPFAKLSEQDYASYAPVADSLIDDITFGRVGAAVEREEELPSSVVTLYAALASAMPSFVESTGVVDSELSSFSNGVDSYSFNVAKNAADKLYSSLQWLIDALPVEWTSACVSPKCCGRCRHVLPD